REGRLGGAADWTVLTRGPERKPRIRLWNGRVAAGRQGSRRHQGAVPPDVRKRPASPACRRQQPGARHQHDDVSRERLGLSGTERSAGEIFPSRSTGQRRRGGQRARAAGLARGGRDRRRDSDPAWPDSVGWSPTSAEGETEASLTGVDEELSRW